MDFPTNGCALVAGGSGGIGRAVIRRLAEQGCDVAFTYRGNKDSADEALQEVSARGQAGYAIKVALEDDKAVAESIGHAVGALGPLHTLVYAAGPYIDMRFISQVTPDMFRAVMNQDANGCYGLIHAALPRLRETKGAIVVVGTPAIRRYAARDILSVAPKAAIEGVMKGVAAEEGRFGIRANMVGVGLLTDGMFHRLMESGDFDEKYLEAARRNLALKRLGTAEDIAEAVLFLASSRARWITGQTLMVDGGYAL